MNPLASNRLREAAISSTETSVLIFRASEASLFSKVEAIEACKRNPYQPALVWHPSIFGSMMQLDLRERVAQEIFMTGAFEPDLLWFLSCVIDEGTAVIDGGAHIGFFSLALAQLVGASGRVDAFEPVARTRSHLETNIRNANLSNIFVHGFALWSESAVVEINDWGHEFSAYNGAAAPRIGPETILPEPSVVPTPAVSIDGFVQSLGRSPSLIKLDVESAEYQVISGMRETLANVRPVVILEVGDFPDSRNETELRSSYDTLMILKDLSYTIFEIKNCRLTEHEVSEHVYDYGNLAAIPDEKVNDLRLRTRER